ncbi:MAG: hypothetical protein K2U26_10715, partial [Cyclobacteriaceae bacterium]|nr:hypothetical protein [Cyclobacteriaceae bacterium]
FINPNSSITIAERDQKFIASANLNGKLNINAPFSGTSALLSKISFERMIISNQAPYFRIGSVSFGSPNATENQTISGFPLTLTNIGVKSEEERVGLIVGVKVNFVKAADEGFSGSTLVTVWGKTPSTSEATGAQEQKWKFDKVEVEEVTVRMVKNGVYDLTGSVRFFKGDQLYGNGFKGFLRGSLAKINLSVQAEALFGNNTEIRYWYASALVCSGTGIPLTGFSVYGFGGGAYYQMKPAAASQNNSIGLTASGVRYEPDSKSFLGLKASVFIGTTGKPESMNGDVTLEINLNRSGGINFISFIGNIYFMTPDFSCNPRDVVGMASSMAQGKDSPPVVGSNRSQLSGHVKLLFDNVNNSFLGNVEVYVNVLGGLVQGAGPNKKAGWAELYFSPSNWHIVIGTPSSPIGLEVARLFKSQSYFMMGKNIPGSPPPPAKVSEILGLGADDLDYMRDANALQSGFGFAFGTNLTVDTGDLRFMLFYGRFTAGAGFDIMIKDYGASAHCLGVPPPLGINGWYANGQAYAFLEGKIGIKVSLPFYKGDYEILKIGAAAVLQTRAPNPFWMRGIVGGYYDILGGLVKGRCRFEVTIGKECTIVADDNALGDVTIIAEVAPVAGTKDVSVFNAAQAAFNIPVGQVFEITDNTNRTRYFRANLNELTIRQGTNAPITGTITWNATNDVAAFDAFDVLPPNVELTLRVKVTFEERINNVWTKYVLDGKTIEEVKEAAFTTGPAPDFIPPSNVAYSYPVIDQFNFYPGEYPQGYIVLKRGQPYLFTPDPTVDQKAWFKKSSGTPTQFSYQYDAGNRTVSYSLPSLELNKGYSFELVNLPKAQTAVDTNVSKVEKVTTTGEVETKVTTKDIEGTIEQGGPKVIYAAKLRTSMYNTFGDKMNAQLQTVPVIFDSPGVFQSILTGNFRLTEPFDALEIGATDLNNNLVQIEADLTNPWYESKIHPLVYEGYPLNSYMTVTNRNVTINGLPPIKSIQLNQPVPYPTLSNPTTSTTVPRLIHSTQVFAYWDFNDIIQHVANFIANGGAFTPRFRQIMIGTVANYDPGPYKVNFSYYLPGTRQKTSTRTLTMSWTLAKPK